MMKLKKALVTIISFLMCVTLFSIVANAQGSEPDTSNTQDGTSDGVEINYVNFPDERFREYFVRNCDSDGDGKLSDEEISNVTVLNVFSGFSDYDKVGSIKGIEYFSSLEELTIYEDFQLTEIDFSQNKNLKSLSIYYCNNLYSIDISKNTELIGLGVYFCPKVKSIDLSNNTKLRSLNLQHTPIEVLDISNNTEFKDIIDVSNFSCTKYDHSYTYEYSDFDNHINKSLTVDLDTKLVYLKSEELGNVVTVIDESVFPDSLFREYVSKYDQNSDGKLSEKEINTISLLDFNGKQITSLKGIELLSSLKILKVAECQLSELNISNNEALEYLDCGGNSISELDLSNNKNLKTLICRDNGIKGLDLSKNDNLIVLICSGNPIKVADISKTNIKVLRCSNCELDELICRDGMYELDCSNNNLSEIKNLSFSNVNSENYYFYFEGYINEGTYGGGCALNCSNNEFSELNLSGITELYDFNCSNNKLMKIDVSNNTNLYRFDCSYNNLSQIDVSDNTNLYEFDCSHNNISKIEIVNSLGWVYCSNNQLKEFDASNITYGFNCSNNQIETLIIGSNGLYFKCYNNKLKTLDVSDNFAKDYCYSYTKDGVTFYTNSEYLNSDWTVDHFSVMSYLIVDESTNVFPIEKKYVIKLIPGSDELQGDGFTIYDSIEADGDYTLPDCEFTAPEGYEFDLWEVKIGSNEAVYYNSGDVISVSDHMNVTATWKKAPCYVFEDGVLTLKGEISADEIKQYDQKNSVKSIKAEDGTVFPEDCSSLFVGYTACETIDFSNVDTSNVTDMSNMFSFLYIKKLDLSGFDMSSVTNAEKMFLGYPYSVPDEITLGEKFTKIDSSMDLMNGYLGWTCGSTDSEKVSGDEWHPAVISNTGKNTYYKKRAKWDDLDYEFSVIETVIPDTSIGNIGILQVVHTPEELYNEEHLACEWRRDGELINNVHDTSYVLKKEDIGHTFTCLVYDMTVETSGYKNAEFDGSGKVGKAVLNFTSEELEAKWETEPCSENGAADGKIYNLTENVEYATKADFSDSKKCSDAKPEDWVTTDKGVALTGFAAGTYYLRYFETDTCEASETAVVVVEEPKREVTWGDTEIIIFKYVLYQPYQNIEVPRYGDTLYAYIATSDGSYTIPGLSEQYQWMRGDEIIEGATNNMYIVQKEDIGYIISCVVSDESGTITGSIIGKTKAKADKAYFGSKAEELARAWKTEPCTKKGSSDGRIYNLAATIEIATNPDFKDSFFAGDIGKEYYVVTDEGMALEYFKAGTYYLRVPEDDTQYASETVTLVILDGPADDLTGTVSINGTTKYGQTLIAKVTDSNANEFNYQWKRGDDDINGATASTYTLAKEDIGKIVSCVVTDKSEYTEGNISGKTSVKIEKADGPAAPAGVKGTACSENGSSDGQITGTDSSMEYATIADFSDKKKCDGTVTGLAAGTYYARIAETDTAKAGASVEIVIEDGPEVQKTQEELVSDFVKRFYTIILEREEVSDEEIDYYTTRLMSREIDGCSVARGFVMSPEYINKFEDDSTFVNKMYAAFFNREADAAQYYCDILAMGYSREVVLAGFVNSPEFKNLCAEYGIEPGELIIDSENNNQGNNQGSNEENNQGNNEENNQGNNEENNQGNNEENNQGNNPSDDITKLNLDSTNVDPEKLDNYVQNLYLQILGRGFDEGGLEYWKENIMSGEVYDAATAARVGFFESPEYQEKNKTNEEFVIDCYHAFLGRDPEPEGLAYWTEKLDSGEYSKQKVIDLGFGHSEEFKNILRDCGFGIIE